MLTNCTILPGSINHLTFKHIALFRLTSATVRNLSELSSSTTRFVRPEWQVKVRMHVCRSLNSVPRLGLEEDKTRSVSNTRT